VRRRPAAGGAPWRGAAAALLALGLALAGAVSAEERRFGRGRVEVTLAGGASYSHNVTLARDLDDRAGAHALPHVGLFLTDELGHGWYRGSLEVLVEPTLIRLEEPPDATVGGVAVLGRWVLASESAFHPFVEAGGGVLGGQVRLRQTNCDVNFILQGGVGVMWFTSERTALTVGYRYHHISNAGRCSPNLGLNSSLLVLGLTYFFP
jgi:hypothetical protein